MYIFFNFFVKICVLGSDYMNDTIAAISTTMGVGAISIIRVSGNDAINIVNKIFDGNYKLWTYYR